jgi:hypothetical protein
VALDETVDHVRAYYDTVFDDLSTEHQLEDSAKIHAEVDRHRSIRAYNAEAFHVGKLREALELEEETAARPAVVIVDGAERLAATDVKALRGLAAETDLELWLGVACNDEKVEGLPERFEPAGDEISVILALEPRDDAVALRALKDHDSPDVSALHVALDPRTLLLVRN